MGKAIVASRLGQIGEVLTDRASAILVEPGNSDMLAAALSEVASDRELRRSLGRNARQTVIEKHTWRQNAQRVLDTYRTLNA